MVSCQYQRRPTRAQRGKSGTGSVAAIQRQTWTASFAAGIDCRTGCSGEGEKGMRPRTTPCPGQRIKAAVTFLLLTALFLCTIITTLSGRAEMTLMKIVVDGATDRVLGVHILGEDASEMAQILGIAVKMGAKKADFDATMALHPTSAEETRHPAHPHRAVRAGNPRSGGPGFGGARHGAGLRFSCGIWKNLCIRRFRNRKLWGAPGS